jgi:hypothetical protein
MAQSPHWLDGIIGHNQNPVSLLQSVLLSNEFLAIAIIAVEKGLKAARPDDEDYARRVRTAICRGIQQIELDLNRL